VEEVRKLYESLILTLEINRFIW